MVTFAKTEESGAATGTATRQSDGLVVRTLKHVVRYDDTEANRLGVPMVDSKSWFTDMIDSPGNFVSRLARRHGPALC